MDHTTPTRNQLTELWLDVHFKNTPCLVFTDPLGDGNRISLLKDRLGITCGTQLGSIINSSVFILPQVDPESILPQLPQEEFGFILSWNGQIFTSHN